MNLSHAMAKSRYGAIIISVILGLGLASIFRRACHGDGCVVIRSPEPDEINGNTYRLGDACYRYSAHVAPCQLPAREAKA